MAWWEKMPQLRCPVCGLPVEIPEDALPGELYEHDCGTTLELYEDENGLSLRVFESLGEDWGE